MSNQVTYRGVKYTITPEKRIVMETLTLQYRGKTYSKVS
tara:strand:- start:2008 stop:2124 length:117 start_codon:yes stop_codon:yes gene_type:complete